MCLYPINYELKRIVSYKLLVGSDFSPSQLVFVVPKRSFNMEISLAADLLPFFWAFILILLS